MTSVSIGPLWLPISGQVAAERPQKVRVCSNRQTEVPRRDGRVRQTGHVRSSVQPDEADQMGRSCESAVRGTGTGPEVPGTLHTPGGYFEQPDSVDCGRQGDLSVEGLCGRQQ